ncbi:MAG: energy transducer TonB [Alphaproteobacteria bacterium]|nr:energy transducer TonB [Alphaproteobacteria bacterium]
MNLEDPDMSGPPAASELVLLQGGLRPAQRRMRRLGAVVSAFGGLALVLGLVMSLNAEGPKKPEGEARAAVEVDIPPKPPPKQKPRKQRPPPPQRPKSNPPPTPNLGASLAGLDLGLPGFGAVGLDGLSDGLLGEVKDTVMTEDAVDAPPQPVSQVPPEYPSRARAKNITGYVTLNVRVGFDGRVEDVRVVEAQPQGVFEQPAVAAVKQWRFQPATYEGRPVTVRVRQTLRFALE